MQIHVPRFAEDGTEIVEEFMGNETLFPAKGVNGSLKVKVKVENEAHRWRCGSNVHSKHYLNLA